MLRQIEPHPATLGPFRRDRVREHQGLTVHDTVEITLRMRWTLEDGVMVIQPYSIPEGYSIAYVKREFVAAMRRDSMSLGGVPVDVRREVASGEIQIEGVL